MGDQHCYQNQPMDGQRVDAHREPPTVAPSGPYVDAIELLLRHVANALNQNQYTDCVLVWHFELAADYLEVKTSRHLGTAARLKRRH